MGLTYFKIKSPYAGDMTKFCSLNGIEIDNNFLHLEGMDITSITFDGENIIFARKNGELIKVPIGVGGETVLKQYQELDNPLPENTILPCSLVDGVSKDYRYVRVDQQDYEGISFNQVTSFPQASSETPLYITDGNDYYRRVDFADGNIVILKGQNTPTPPNKDKFYFYEGKFYQYFKGLDGVNQWYYGQAIIVDGMVWMRALEMLEHLVYNVDAGYYDQR